MDAYGFATSDSGPQKYFFEINLFESIDVEATESSITLNKHELHFVLKKGDPTIWWSRLTAQPQKQNWILIDTDRWISRDSDELINKQPEFRDIRLDYPGIDECVQEAELGYRKTNPKIAYLIIYNLFQFIGYLFILVVIWIGLHRDGYEKSVKTVYSNVGNAMKFCQLLQYLEVMHPMFGYTKGSPLFPFMQVSGRNFVLFMMIEAEPRIQTKPVILYLFICWSVIECVRYPYYVLSLVKHEIGLLTWIRYTIWIPLYPLGALCEGIILLRNIPYFEETKRFNVSMPNKWNFTFCMCTFIKFYILFGLLPGIYFLMKYMASTRAKKLKTMKINYQKSIPKDRKTI